MKFASAVRWKLPHLVKIRSQGCGSRLSIRKECRANATEAGERNGHAQQRGQRRHDVHLVQTLAVFTGQEASLCVQKESSVQLGRGVAPVIARLRHPVVPEDKEQSVGRQAAHQFSNQLIHLAKLPAHLRMAGPVAMPAMVDAEEVSNDDVRPAKRKRTALWRLARVRSEESEHYHCSEGVSSFRRCSRTPVSTESRSITSKEGKGKALAKVDRGKSDSHVSSPAKKIERLARANCSNRLSSVMEAPSKF